MFLPLDQVLFFFLPAMVANLILFLTGHYYGTSVVVPLDLRGRIAGKRLVGEGRGLTSLPRALAAGMLCGALQGRLEEAVVLSLGAQLGMVANSVIKRRRCIPRGGGHLPWDHIDFVLGASLVYWLHFPMSLALVLSGLVYCGVCHLVVGHLVRAVLGE
ncbi:MAG: CDP-archaeol synthase [Candidatus Eremiobacteraeota bacterium]|nr:CDP-archaeol synthase [Candidatus Eremiobacteraeota bacterium]